MSAMLSAAGRRPPRSDSRRQQSGLSNGLIFSFPLKAPDNLPSRFRAVFSGVVFGWALTRPLAPIAAQATDPHAVQPERPTVATHASVVARGWVEIETGFERDRFEDRTVGVGVPTVVKIGIARRLQLSLGIPLGSPPGENIGLGDLSAGIKWRIADHAPILQEFAILPAIKFPSGASSAGRGTGTTDVSLLAISSRTIGPVAIDLNAGITHRSGDGSEAPKTASVWAASFGFELPGPWGWVAEAFGYPGTSGPAGSDGTVALLTGPTYTLRPSMALDLGLIIPITGPNPSALYAGLTWNLGRLWTPRLAR
jgi:hypothetical protein